MGTITLLRRGQDGAVLESSGGKVNLLALEPFEERWIDAGAGLLVEQSIGCHHEPSGTDDPLPYRVDMWAEYSETTARYEVSEISATRLLGGPPVTSDGLRSIPVAGFLRGLAAHSLWGHAESPSKVKLLDPPPRESFGRGRLGDDDYRKIALVHRLHEVLGSRATTSTAEHFGVTTTTVQNWMKEARARGLTEPFWNRRP